MIDRAHRREWAATVLVVLGLALPAVPLPGDTMSRMAVQFRTEGMSRSRSVAAHLPKSVCTVLAATLARPATASGAYTAVTCSP